MVILVHFGQSFVFPRWIKCITGFGQMGCQIFFVMSAYTLCLSLEKKHLSTYDFLKRRVLRIVPGYWSAILIFFLFRILLSIVFNADLNIYRNPLNIIMNIFLLNGLIPTEANNLIVRGGWYIGTSMILYLITPFLFAVFNHSNKSWHKIRAWMFPIISVALSFLIQILAARIDNRFICRNNNFIYFSFVNQLPAFTIGFSLYDTFKKKINKILCLGGCLISLYISCILFYSDINYAFIFVPWLFAVSVFFAFCYLNNMMRNINTKKAALYILKKFGEHSFGIYLMHSFIVYEGVSFVKKILDYMTIETSESLLFIMLLPFVYAAVYIAGLIFEKYLKCVNKAILK